MHKLKLFFLINSLHTGGAERVVSTLSNSFCMRNFQVSIVCLNYSKQGYPIHKNVRIIYLLDARKSDSLIGRIYYAMKIYFGLLNLLIKERPKVVVAFMTTSNLYAGLTCGLIKIPYIVSERITPELTIKRFRPVLRFLSVGVFKNAKAIVSPARGIENCLKEIKGFNDLLNYRVINNPVHPIIPSDQEACKALHQKPFVLAVGRLTPQKGFDFLIDSFSRIIDLDIDLLIIGQGPEESRLNEQINRLGLSDRVFLLGVKINLQNYYRQADVFVLSSRNEGYPNALIEAMSMRCACIAMNCRFGPSEIIQHRINGVLVENYDPLELAHAIRDLMVDIPFRKRMSQNASLINKTNSLDVVMNEWEQLIHAK